MKTSGYSGMPLVKKRGINLMLIERSVLKNGLVEVKVCAVDQDWSGLKFVFRRIDR